MTPMPTWWLVISAFAYICLAIVCISLAVTAFFVVKFLKDVQPRVASIEGQVKELVGKVQELTTNINETVNNVGGRARGVVGSAEGMAQSASRQFERFSPFVVGALTAIRLVKALKEAKEGRSLAKATSKKGILRKKPKGFISKILGR